MSGKVCLVTGATAGLGRVTAQSLAGAGATVVLVGRDAGRCAGAVEQICAETGNPSVESLQADLSSQRDVRALADQFRQRYGRLDVLVNDAGAVFYKRQESVDGIEMTFALNHLAYFLLTNLLLDMLKGSAPSRVVNVSSEMHKRAKLDLNDLQGLRRYNGNMAYQVSKLCNLLLTYQLARSLQGSRVTVNALSPGLVSTRLGLAGGGMMSLGKRVVNALIGVSAEVGARTIIYLATSPEVSDVTGQYFVNGKAVASSPLSCDRQMQERLWRISEELTGLRTG